MLEIAKSNGKTSNNSASLAAAALAISIARLIAITLIILVAATPPKLATPIIAAPLKHNTCKAIKGYAASSAS
jgi:hypothetical protein